MPHLARARRTQTDHILAALSSHAFHGGRLRLPGLHHAHFGAPITVGHLSQDLLLDIHLREHVSTLYEDIRSKALIQYFSPFVSVDMRRMARRRC